MSPPSSRWLTLSVGLYACLGAPAPAQDLQITAPAAAEIWRRAEFQIANVPTVENPFDPDQIRVDATVVAPSGTTMEVPAFWFQDYERSIVDGAEVLHPVGQAGWRVRVTPTETGEHILAMTVALGGHVTTPPTETRFSVGEAPEGGWVRVAADKRWFETSDGRLLRLVGENVCWGYGRDTYEYDMWFAAMHASGQNFARLWMSPWSIGIEHGPGTLNRYSLTDAWQLDHVFDLAERLGIHLLLAFDHHGMFFTNDANWGGTNNFWRTDNPYSTDLGGPCATPAEFFTRSEARTLYKKRLRYLVARWGCSPNLLAWQFFNEIDNAYAPRGVLQGADVADWHREMGQWLRAHDPWQHLVTTSLTGRSDRPEIWTLPEMDFAVYHSYNEPAPARRLAAIARDFTARYDKPVMIGEFGIDSRSWNIAADPYLRGLRQGLWGGALGGSVGSSMSWWWEAIDEHNVYPLYAAMSGILKRAGWFEENDWAPLDFISTVRLPGAVGEAVPDGEIFDANLRLIDGWRPQGLGTVAINNRLAVERSGETLCAYVQGSRNARMGTAIRLAARLGLDARLVMHVNSVGADAELVVRVDGGEVFREKLPDTDGRSALSNEIDRDLVVALPVGAHVIEIANEDVDWFYLDTLKIEKVVASEAADGGHFEPEPIGLRRGDRAVLYVVSPWTVFPASAQRYNPPEVLEATVTLANWPEGDYRAEWYDTRTGACVATTGGPAHDGILTLPLPAFREDIAGIVTPVP